MLKANRKTLLTILAFLPALVVLPTGVRSVYGNTATILLVSDCSAPGTYTGIPPDDVNERDNTLVLFLEGLGYTVDTSGMNKAYQKGQIPFNDPAKLTALDSADLVLVSRHTDSLYYDNDRQNWNKLKKPLLLMNGYLTRGGDDNRWGWTTGGSAYATLTETNIVIEAGQETHPFVAGFTSPIVAFDWSSAPTPGEAPKWVFLPNSAPVAGSIVIGRFDGMPILMDIPAGTDFDAGNTNGPYGIAGGPRGLLVTWGYDIYLGTPYNRDATFTDFLTEDYLALFAQMLNELVHETIYVDANAPAGGDGWSWATAFKYLQDGLTIAWSGVEIRVAQGTYKPDATSSNPSGSGDQTATFQLIDGVTIKGGYAGLGEADPNARDIEAYETILSGDIGTVGVNTDNSYHVVTGSGTDGTAILDGLTITGGNANGGTYPNNYGGGMFNVGGSPTVTNCRFISNSAISDFYDGMGGGMYNLNSSPTVTDCTFNDNASVYDSGGGMYNGGDMYSGGDSSPTLTNCTFNDNTAGQSGGGVCNGQYSSPTVTDCTFSGNEALAVGGGIFNAGTVTNCTFIGNSAGNGGGICYGGPNVTNCLFKDNSADNYGGGLYFSGNSQTVANCTFTNNEAVAGGGIYGEENILTVTGCRFIGNSSEQGGGMFKRYGTLTLTNCTFIKNSVTLKGGGLHNFENGSPKMTNCTFSGNSAGDSGGGIYNENSGPTVTNCILWGDEPNEIANYTSNPTITYCDVQGGWGDPNDPNNNNINVEPSFVDVNNPDPNLWNLRLKPDSPCIDAADSTVLLTVPVPVDLDGNVRCFDVAAKSNTGSGPLEFLDMGAYEFNCNYAAGDNNCDGVVNFKDVAILAGNWLAGIEPEL